MAAVWPALVTFPFGREIGLIRRTKLPTPDAYGDDQYTVTEETVRGAYSPAGSAEAKGTGVVTQPTVYLPPGLAPLTFNDAVRVDGVIYEIDGDPMDWQNPFTGHKPGIEVRLVGRST